MRFVVATTCALAIAACGSSKHRSDAGLDAGRVEYDAGLRADPRDPSTWHIEPERPSLRTRPVWDPGFGPFGEPDSETIFCNRDTGEAPDNAALAVAGSSVHVAIAIRNAFDESGYPWTNRPGGFALHTWHDGAWTERFWAPDQVAANEIGIAGDADGNVFLSWDFGCGLSRLAPGPFSPESLSCFRDGIGSDESLIRMEPGDDGIGAVVTNENVYERSNGTFVAIDAFAAAVLGHSRSTISDLARDDARVALAGAAAMAFVYDRADDTLTDLSEELPAGDILSVGLLADDDVLVAYATNDVVRRTATGLSTFPPFDDGGSAPMEFVAYAGTTYYRTTYGTFGTVDATGPTPIADLPQDRYSDLRDIAVGPSGVYMLIEDRTTIDFTCGSFYVVRYDGTEFHTL